MDCWIKISATSTLPRTLSEVLNQVGERLGNDAQVHDMVGSEDRRVTAPAHEHDGFPVRCSDLILAPPDEERGANHVAVAPRIK